MDKRYNNSYLKNLYLDELSKTIGEYQNLTDQLNDIVGTGKGSMTNLINQINAPIAANLDEDLIAELKANRAETPFEVDLKDPKPIVKAFAKMNRANQSWLLDQEGDNYKFMALKNLSEQTRYLRSFLVEAGKAVSYDETKPIADLVTFLSSTDEVLSKLSEQVDKNNNTMNVDVDFWKNYSNFLSGEINALKNSIVRGEMARAVAESVEKDEAAPIFVNTNTANTLKKAPFVAQNTAKVNNATNTTASAAVNNVNVQANNVKADAQVSNVAAEKATANTEANAAAENVAANTEENTGDAGKKAKKGKFKKQLKAILAGVLCAGYVAGAAFLGKAWGKATAKAEIDKKDAQIGQLEDKLDNVYDKNGNVREEFVMNTETYKKLLEQFDYNKFQLDLISSELVDAKEEFKYLYSKVFNKNGDIREDFITSSPLYQQLVEDTARQVEELQAENARQKAEYDDLYKKYEAALKNGNNSDLIAELESQLKSKNDTIGLMQIKISGLENDLKDKTNELMNLQRKCEALQKQIDDHQCENQTELVKKLREELKASQEQTDAANARADKAEADRQAAAAEAANAKAEAEAAKKDKAEAERKAQEAAEKLAEAERRAQAAEEEAARAKANEEKALTDLANAKQTISDMAEIIKNLQDKQAGSNVSDVKPSNPGGASHVTDKDNQEENDNDEGHISGKDNRPEFGNESGR